MLKNLLENLWLHLLAFACGALVASQFERVKDTLHMALNDPVGAVGVILMIAGLTGFLLGLAHRTKRKETLSTVSLVVNLGGNFLMHYLRTVDMLPHLQGDDIKQRLRDLEDHARRVTDDIAKALKTLE